MIQKEELEMCKRDIESCKGMKVRLKTNGGRKRTLVREGIVEDIYPKVFTVRVVRDSEDEPEVYTYSYIDIMTGTVEVSVEPEAFETIQESYAKLEEAIKADEQRTQEMLEQANLEA